MFFELISEFVKVTEFLGVIRRTNDCPIGDDMERDDHVAVGRCVVRRRNVWEFDPRSQRPTMFAR